MKIKVTLRKIPFKGNKTRKNKNDIITYLKICDKIVIINPLPERLKNVKLDTKLKGAIGKYIGSEKFFGINVPVFRIGRYKVRGWECYWIRKDEAERILEVVKKII